jgi:hypothetical protein
MKHLEKITILILSITVIIVWNEYQKEIHENKSVHEEKHDLIIDNIKKDEMIQNAGMDYNDYRNLPAINVECDKY